MTFPSHRIARLETTNLILKSMTSAVTGPLSFPPNARNIGLASPCEPPMRWKASKVVPTSRAAVTSKEIEIQTRVVRFFRTDDMIAEFFSANIVNSSFEDGCFSGLRKAGTSGLGQV